MRQVTVTVNQNIIDLALQEYGDLSGVFDIWILNPDLNLFTEDLFTGQTINIGDQAINQDVVNEFVRNNHQVSTGSEIVDNWILSDGFWNDNKQWNDFKFWND